MRVEWDKYTVVPRDFGRNIRRAYRIDPTWHSDPVEDHDLWIITGGQGKIRIQNKWTSVRRGACVWLRKGAFLATKVEQDPEDPLEVTFLHFDLVDPQGRLRPDDAPLPPEYIESPDVQMSEAISRRLADLAIGVGTGFHARLPESGSIADIGRRMLTALLMELDHASDASAGSSSTAKGRWHEKMIRTAVLRILEHPDNPPSVEELAAGFDYNRHHFSRIFRQVTHLSPQEFAIEARIQRARELLSRTEMRIGEIAKSLGYRDSFFFSRQFKHQTGMTPTQFRRGNLESE